MINRQALVWIAAGAGAAVLIILASGQWVVLAIAVLMSERRPKLLADAEWKKPSSAARFNARFHPGAPESDLKTWLTHNKFKIDSPGHATRVVSSVPCNEAIEVVWGAWPDGKITNASVEVSEAGCL